MKHNLTQIRTTSDPKFPPGRSDEMQEDQDQDFKPLFSHGLVWACMCLVHIVLNCEIFAGGGLTHTEPQYQCDLLPRTYYCLSLSYLKTGQASQHYQNPVLFLPTAHFICLNTEKSLHLFLNSRQYPPLPLPWSVRGCAKVDNLGAWLALGGWSH